MWQSVQAIGSLLILFPFVLAQARRMSTHQLLYLTLNAIGSTALAIDAAFTRQWGFLLLESVWAAVSAFGILRQVWPHVWLIRHPAPKSDQHEARAPGRDSA